MKRRLGARFRDLAEVRQPPSPLGELLSLQAPLGFHKMNSSGLAAAEKGQLSPSPFANVNVSVWRGWGWGAATDGRLALCFLSLHNTTPFPVCSGCSINTHGEGTYGAPHPHLSKL